MIHVLGILQTFRRSIKVRARLLSEDMERKVNPTNRMPGGFDLNAVDICVEFVDEGDCSQSMVCIDVPPHVVRSIVG